MERSAGSNVNRALRIAVLLVAAPLLLGAICVGGESSSFPELEPFSLEQEQLLHDIRDVAAEVRGLEVNEDTVEGTVSRELFRTYIDEEYTDIDEEDKAEIDSFNTVLRLFHLIGPDDDILELASEGDGNSILGLYFFEEDKLVFIADDGAEIAPLDEMILAHEYVHSFQDAAYDSKKLRSFAENDDGDSRTEYRETVSCLKEGDATLSMYLYMEEVYGQDWRDVAFADDGEENADEVEDSLPPALKRYDAFNYRECYRFVSALYNEGGWEAVDAAYLNPPSTTEQILHPDKFLKAEASRSPAPSSIETVIGEDWSLFDLSPFGEFDVYNYVTTVLEDEFAGAQAAAGWGSGWTSIYVKDQEDLEGDAPVLVHLRLDWDTTLDFLEFMAAFGEVVNVVSDGEWELDEGAATLRWENVNEYGYVTWNEKLNRIDIVISSEQQPRDDVASAQILRP